MSAPAPDVDRLLSLLADRALEGLTPGRAAELAGLLADIPGLDDEALDRAAAQVHLALAPSAGPPPPARLRRVILADLERSFDETPRRPPPPSAPQREPQVDWGAPDPGAEEEAGLPDPDDAPPLRTERFRAPPPPRRPQASAWSRALAAAGWVLAGLIAALWLATGARSGLEARLDRAPDRLELAWSPGPGGPAVTGNLSWSTAEQAGLAELSGLAPNAPGERRYQLWVVDGAAGGRAVPAALFDAGGEPVRVTLAPALPVGRADRFALTLEGPQGALAAGSRLKKPLAVAVPAEPSESSESSESGG